VIPVSGLIPWAGGIRIRPLFNASVRNFGVPAFFYGMHSRE